MRYPLALVGILLSTVLVLSSRSLADFPKPSVYPKSWELDFENTAPKRIVVQVPGESTARAFWYMTYTVTNKTDREQLFYPDFQLLTADGKVVPSDRSVPAVVFDTIKQREKLDLLEPFTKITGEILLGDDQARDGVAIWTEPVLRMGSFSIFVGGLSGESVELKDSAGAPVKDAQGAPIILRKTLQLNFQVRGDEVYPAQDEPNRKAREWIMR